MSRIKQQRTTVAIEMEPGGVDFKVASRQTEPSRIELFLPQKIDDWFRRPSNFCHRTRPTAITHGGETLGIHVWYHEADESQPQAARRQRGR